MRLGASVPLRRRMESAACRRVDRPPQPSRETIRAVHDPEPKGRERTLFHVGTRVSGALPIRVNP